MAAPWLEAKLETLAAWRPGRTLDSGLAEVDPPDVARAENLFQRDFVRDVVCKPGSADSDRVSVASVDVAGAGGGSGSGGTECPAPGRGGTGDNSGSGWCSAGVLNDGSSVAGWYGPETDDPTALPR